MAKKSGKKKSGKKKTSQGNRSSDAGAQNRVENGQIPPTDASADVNGEPTDSSNLPVEDSPALVAEAVDEAIDTNEAASTQNVVQIEESVADVQIASEEADQERVILSNQLDPNVQSEGTLEHKEDSMQVTDNCQTKKFSEQTQVEAEEPRPDVTESQKVEQEFTVEQPVFVEETPNANPSTAETVADLEHAVENIHPPVTESEQTAFEADVVELQHETDATNESLENKHETVAHDVVFQQAAADEEQNILEMQQQTEQAEVAAPVAGAPDEEIMFWEQTANDAAHGESLDFLTETNEDQMPWELESSAIEQAPEPFEHLGKSQPQSAEQVEEPQSEPIGHFQESQSQPVGHFQEIQSQPVEQIEAPQPQPAEPATEVEADQPPQTTEVVQNEDGDVSDSFLEDSAEPSAFWTDDNKGEMPWEQTSEQMPDVHAITHPESLLSVESEEDDSFLEKLTQEVQNKMQKETEAESELDKETSKQEEDKFGFLEEDEDDILDDIMDDDLLDSDDDPTNYPINSTMEANNSVIYNPLPQKEMTSAPQKVNPYKPQTPAVPSVNNSALISPSSSFIGDARLGINSFRASSNQSEQAYNSKAAEVHQKLEAEKKKSDAYDFPVDLISKRTKKTPVAAQNVYTKIESTLSKHEPAASNFAMPPKIGDHTIPESQKTSRSGSVTTSSFFTELPVQHKNPPKPAHLRNPYEAIEKSSAAQQNILEPSISAPQPPVAKKRNPYAPTANLPQQPSTTSQFAAPQVNTPNQSQRPGHYAPPVPPLSMPAPTSNMGQQTNQFLQPPVIAPGNRRPSTTKKSNPYAPAEAGGHIRRVSQDPKPVDINPNLVSVPVASPITGQYPPVNQFAQPQNQFVQGNNFNQVGPTSPVNQYAPSSSGSMGQGFTFPEPVGAAKYAPGGQPQSAMSSIRRSTRVGRPSVSSINEVYGSNIVTSNASPTNYKRKSVMPPGGTTKSKHAGSNSISIAPAPVVINPENLSRRQWPLFDFSAENFVSMIPIANAYGSSLCSFQINNYNAIMKETSLAQSFPGPLNKTRSKRKEISKWLDDKLAEVTKDNVDDILVNEEQLLWKVLKLLVEKINKKGDFTSNLEYQSSLLQLLNPSLSEMDIKKEDVFDVIAVRNLAMSFNPSSAPNSFKLDQNMLAPVHDLLEKGEKASALEFALGKGDWTLSLLIANLISPLAFNHMLKLYMTSNYGDNNMSNDLNFFLQSTSADGMSAEELTGKESWIVDNYKSILPFILKNSKSPGKSLFNIGEKLIKSGYHVYGKIALLISGEPLVPTCNDMLPSSIDAMMIDEIYEYLLMSSDNMPAQFLNGLPHMVPVKIRHAGYLADFGLVNEAKKYTAATQSDVSSKLLFVEPSTAIAQQNITERLSQLGSNWLGVSRPKLDKVWNTLDKSFTKFVSGEEKVEVKKTDDVMFSKFTSPSVSRIGSHLDLGQVQFGIEQGNKPLSTINSVSTVPSVYGNTARLPGTQSSTPNTFNPGNPYFNGGTIVNPSVVSSPHRGAGNVVRPPPVTSASVSTPRGKYAPIGEQSNEKVVSPPNPGYTALNMSNSPVRVNRYSPNIQHTTQVPSKSNIPLPIAAKSPAEGFSQQTFEDVRPPQPPKATKNASPYSLQRENDPNASSSMEEMSQNAASPYGSRVSLNAGTSKSTTNDTIPSTEPGPVVESANVEQQMIENFEQDIEPVVVDTSYEEDLEDSVVEDIPSAAAIVDEVRSEEHSTPQAEEVKTIVSPVESIVSTTSTNSAPPAVRGPPVNRYAPQSASKRTGNPYAPKASKTQSSRSVYAPKEPLQPLAQNDDPLEAMGITGDVDMFAATRYTMPPPAPEEAQPVEESEPAEVPLPEKELKVDAPIPMMQKSEIHQNEPTQATHLRDMFEEPKLSVSESDMTHRKSPIYTITEEKKFYAEDTGEYYDDIIDDEGDDDDDGAEAEAERQRQEAERKRREEEEQRKKKEEEEEKKKKQEEASSTRSWFGMFGGSTKSEKKVYKAKLGEENSFYYDEKLQRWINGKESVEDQINASKPPPPPPAAKKATPSGGAPPGGAPPPQKQFSPMSGTPQTSSPGPSAPGSVKGGSIDDLLNRAPPGGSATRKAKRGPRRGYVDVMAQP